MLLRLSPLVKLNRLPQKQKTLFLLNRLRPIPKSQSKKNRNKPKKLLSRNKILNRPRLLRLKKRTLTKKITILYNNRKTSGLLRRINLPKQRKMPKSQLRLCSRNRITKTIIRLAEPFNMKVI